MSLSVCRLELAEVGRAEQVWPRACQHESLQDLGQSQQVRDIEPGLLQQWKHLRSLVSGRKLSSLMTRLVVHFLLPNAQSVGLAHTDWSDALSSIER